MGISFWSGIVFCSRILFNGGFVAAQMSVQQMMAGVGEAGRATRVSTNTGVAADRS